MTDTLPLGLPTPVRAVFLSDVHLKEPEDANYRALLALLADMENLPDRGGLPSQAGLPDLYILGDFFDFWFGFSRVVPSRYVPVLAALKRLADGGTRIHFVEGNHDFHMGDYFTRTLGAVVHADFAEVSLDGRRLYLAHGDLVDVNDRGYLRMRRALRSAPVRWLADAIPPRWLLSFADWLHGTAGGPADGPRHLAGRFRAFAEAKWRAGYDGVLLGHCHVPELLEADQDGRPCFYANSGDWLRHDTFVAYDGESFSLRRAGP